MNRIAGQYELVQQDNERMREYRIPINRKLVIGAQLRIRWNLRRTAGHNLVEVAFGKQTVVIRLTETTGLQQCSSILKEVVKLLSNLGVLPMAPVCVDFGPAGKTTYDWS